MRESGVQFRLLGPLEALDGGEPLALGGRKQRAVLAILLLHANDVVSTDRLIDDLWRDQPPEGAVNALQAYVSRLRKVLPADLLVTQSPGYVLRIAPEQLDSVSFERLAGDGRLLLREGKTALAADRLRDALSLWRGSALADFAFEPFAESEIARLEELRLVALEDRLDADLALGRHAELVAELEALAAELPLRERLRGQLIVALYRCGRQADALTVYRETRQAFVEELGLEPSPELQRLEKAVLTHDPALQSPARPAPRSGTNLPAPQTSLVGREAELREACALARREDVRLVTLTGPGGIGKTRLAIEAARELADEFEDGVFFVPLEPISDAALVGPTIAKTLGVVGGGGQTSGEALEHYLADRSLLLVLDNFEQVLPTAPLLAALLSHAPRVKALVTSRTLLRLSGEHEFAVPPLLRTAAVDLFVKRARAVNHGFTVDGNAGAIAELCARLDGLPLAIELAAARSRVLSPQAILDRLGTRLELLTRGPRDAPARQQTLRRTIDWSYELLEPDDRSLFARLAVFVGGCTAEAAEAVCAAGEEAILEGLAALADGSLIRQESVEEARLGMLETVREYALERLAASGEEPQLRRRHAEYYLGLAETAEQELHGSEQGRWLERLDREHGNLRAALAFALESGDGETALRIAAALRWFWHIHGHIAEGRRWTEAALARAGDAPELTQVKALNGAGIVAAEQGDHGAARRFFAQSLALARKLGRADRIAAALANLGNLALFEGDYEGARAHYEESVGLWREAENVGRTAATTENLGCVAMLEGDLARAIALFEESEALADKAGDIQQRASSKRALVRALVLEGELDRAAALADASLTLTIEVGERAGLAEGLDACAGLAAMRDDAPMAATLFGAADAVLESIGALRTPDHRPWYERVATLVRSRLDDAAFARAYERGRELPPDEAVELARAVSREPARV
jgi:predicted ATPase/DNA-binding SARP family transcriptional activator